MFVAVALDTLTNGLLAAIAIGLLIFIHELGHFLVAKKVGIRVEVFSLGFGPRLFGFRRGPTDYRLSLIPIGGYVKLAGDSPAEQATGAPDEFRSKSVGQRTAVIAAGVVMNALFAFVAFPIVFHAGVPFDAPVIGALSPGGAAWQARLEPGDRILEVDGERVYGFEDVQTLLALGNDPAGVSVVVERAGQPPFELRVKPRPNAAMGASEIGIQPAIEGLYVEEDSLAYKQGLRTGDHIVAVEDIPTDSTAGALKLYRLLGKDRGEIPLKIEREGSRLDVVLKPERVETGSYWIGIERADNRVTAVREGVSPPRFEVREGDILRRVEGTVVLSSEEWADRIRALPIGQTVRIDAHREGRDIVLEGVLSDDAMRTSLVDDFALGANGTIVRVIEAGPAIQQGLKSGDEIVAVNGSRVSTFVDIQERVSKARADALSLEVRRDGAMITLRIYPEKRMERRLELGWRYAQETFRADGVVDALKVGFENSIGMIRRVLLILDRMVIRRTVSPKNLGGVPMIATLSFQYAQLGLAKLFHFLAILSINLAIINLLPIPILDGGHLLFLLIEKVKGSPVSENVIGYAQWAGLILLLSLILFVTYNDILRIFHL